MSNHKAIPTKYNGVQYRSRLEARWAMFFDYLGIEYYYEYEGFQLPSGWYLPDFYLPEYGWFEIKPVEPNEKEWILVNELSTYLKEKSDQWVKLRESPTNKLNYLDPKKQVYILVSFPLTSIYDPTFGFIEDIDSDDYLKEHFQKGNFWIEQIDNGNIIFSPNYFWSTYLTRNTFQIPHKIDRSYNLCFMCKTDTGICEKFKGLRADMLREYEKAEYFNNLVVLSLKENLTKNSLSKADTFQFSHVLRITYENIIDKHKEYQEQCPYNNSKKVNDAYQMASKHRFY